MKIALDYDGTYTADPGLWDAFIVEAVARGHVVFCVTRRGISVESPPSVPMIYTDGASKTATMRNLGEKIAIWIDDDPYWLGKDT